MAGRTTAWRGCLRCSKARPSPILLPRRPFHPSPRRPVQTPPPTDPRFAAPLGSPSSSSSSNASGIPRARSPNNLIALALFVATGAGLFVYFRSEKAKVLEKRKEEMATKSVGRVLVGGPFELTRVDNGQRFSEKDLEGKFSLIYFGFTNCPDICPDELDKMSDVVERINKEFGQGSILPIFVSVDPARDSPEAMRKYLLDFHPTMLGLSGTYDEIKAMCKTYRVYFSTPPDKKPGEDYLVDHSIFFYLMSPNGFFVDAFGRIYTRDEVHSKIRTRFVQWREGKRPGEDDDGLVAT